MRQLDILALTFRYRYIIGVLSAILIVVSLFYNQESWAEHLYRLYIPMGVVTTLQITRSLMCTTSREDTQMNKVYRYLLGTVFFVYATHTVYIVNWVIAGLGRLGPQNGALALIPYFLTPTFTILICLVGYQAMRSLCPRLLGLLTGGRS